MVDDSWKQTAEWKAHDSIIFKLAWAPSEYGDILASCSYDRTVIIWERGGAKSGPNMLQKWINRAKLVDSRQAVNDIAFAPKHLGLQIATCSADGSVRLYEAVDVMNLMHWPLVDEFDVTRDGGGASCMAWSPNQFRVPSLIVGGEKRVQIWKQSDGRKWTMADGSGEHLMQDSVINGVAWAPNLGRSYELLATASQDRTVRIYKLVNSSIIEQACFRDHKSEVWHVEWNVTGTVLASSGDDGVIRLWSKQNGEWKNLNSIAPEK
jgi:nucleoporin SEH1